MKIDLEWDFGDEGKWFDFDEDVRLRLRFVPREKLTGIVQRHTRRTPERRTDRLPKSKFGPVRLRYLGLARDPHRGPKGGMHPGK